MSSRREGRFWSPAEDALLRRSLAIGAMPTDVAWVTGRALSVVHDNARRLGLEWRSTHRRTREELAAARAVVLALWGEERAARNPSGLIRQENASRHAAWMGRFLETGRAPWEAQQASTTGEQAA